MTLRADLLRTVLIQALGAAALLLAVLWLGAALGPEAQGRFSRTKAEIELLGALAMFGLPQAMFYFLQRGELALPRAFRVAAVAGAAGGACALGYALLGPPQAPAGLALVFTVAAACCVWHGELRALLLSLRSTAWFNGVTAMPQVAMLVLAVAWAALGGGEIGLTAGLALAYLAPALLARRVLASGAGAGADVPVATVSTATMLRFGAAAWLTATLGAAAVVVAQRSVESALGAAALGVFTMALSLAQVPLAPVNYAAPLLFRHWMGSERSALPIGRMLLPAAAIGGLAAVAGLLEAWHADFGAGARYAGIGLLLPLLLLAAAGESLLRVLAAHANAQGLPWRVVVAEGLRCAVLAVAALAGGWRFGLAACGVIWVAAAWAAALALGGFAAFDAWSRR